jgi:transcriptional regulator with XRE-family HTH domain
MDQTTIARIEGGSRTVSVDDAFVIAAALDVSPIHLLTPATGEQDMQPAPTTTRSPAQSRRWVLAARPLPGQDEVEFQHEEALHDRLSARVRHALDDLEEEHHQIVQELAELDKQGLAEHAPTTWRLPLAPRAAVMVNDLIRALEERGETSLKAKLEKVADELLEQGSGTTRQERDAHAHDTENTEG